MPRILTLVVCLAAATTLAGVAKAQPFFLSYVTPDGSLPTCDLTNKNPASFQGGDQTAQPVLPPTLLGVGQTLTFDLCYIVWPAVPSAPSPAEAMCLNATGTDSCAEQTQFTTNAGISVVGFSPTQAIAGPPPNFPKYQVRSTPTSLFVAGGHPILGRNGSGLLGIHLGTLTLQGVSPAGTFELTGAGGWVNASGQRMPFINMVVVTTQDTCGDGVVDPGEQCDDGNSNFGDGCSPTCRNEDTFALTGSVGGPGTTGFLFVEIDGVQLILDLSTLPNAPADEVLQALVTSVNDETSLGAIGAQADDPNQPNPNDGLLFVTDGVFTAPPSVSVSSGTLAISVPEPGQIAMLVAGAGLLAALNRRRQR
jgi:cysteine-rich repeat protein